MNLSLRTTILVASLAVCGAASGSIITADPSLPPNIGAYRTPADVHAQYIGPGLDIILSDVLHFGFINVIRTPLGPNERESFDSTVNGRVSINGSPQLPVVLTGPVTTEVFGKTGNVTGTFATEMLQLDLIGGAIMVRESPTLPSVGQTDITDLGGGSFRIDSFFDVFTELSLDGGQSWLPSLGSARVELVPEPATLALLGFGLAALGFASCRQLLPV